MLSAWGERIVRSLIACIPKHHRDLMLKVVEDGGRTLSDQPGSCVPAKLNRGRMPTLSMFGPNSRRIIRADLVLATMFGVRLSFFKKCKKIS